LSELVPLGGKVKPFVLLVSYMPPDLRTIRSPMAALVRACCSSAPFWIGVPVAGTVGVSSVPGLTVLMSGVRTSLNPTPSVSVRV
jgi:hypothetical protein